MSKRQKQKGVEVENYLTQPGFGHDFPSGQISMNDTGQGINVDVADQFWNKSDNSQLDYPVGENEKPGPGYRGPSNDFRRIRYVVRTLRKLIAPRSVPR